VSLLAGVDNQVMQGSRFTRSVLTVKPFLVFFAITYKTKGNSSRGSVGAGVSCPKGDGPLSCSHHIPEG